MIQLLLFLALINGGPNSATEINFTGSTPAGKTVRDFLEIKPADSIDFIRWNLSISNLTTFQLTCTYGISKANTNGFVDEQKAECKGIVSFSDGVLTLTRQKQRLSMLVLNRNIFHFLSADGTLMVGNAGWSYTLNSLGSGMVSDFTVKRKDIVFTDSIVFDGRTPCRGIEEMMENKTRPECYKKKWRVSLYRDQQSDSFGTYRIGTINGRTGKWQLKENAAGRRIYSLDLNNGNSLDLFMADENIAYIMDGKGGLMVGDHDFSYSLNRKDKIES
jgi:hypothetical protein